MCDDNNEPEPLNETNNSIISKSVQVDNSIKIVVCDENTKLEKMDNIEPTPVSNNEHENSVDENREELNETERDQIRDKIVKLLDTALYSAIWKEKLKTNDGSRQEIKRILKSSPMSKIEKVEMLNEFLKELYNNERQI